MHSLPREAVSLRLFVVFNHKKYITKIHGGKKMKNKRRLLGSIILAVLIVALAIVPMLAVSASAADASASLSFANKAQRTSFSTSKQVWEQNGITFTNEKAASTNAVADYASPVRLYAGSKVTIAHATGLITKIEFTANSSSYATALKNSIGSEATASSSKVTWTIGTPAASVTIAKLTAQVRLNSLVVYYQEQITGGGDCDHEWDEGEVTTPATCKATGVKTYGCNLCDAEMTEPIEKLDHNWDNGEVTNPATCVAYGVKTYTCNGCDATKTEQLDMIDHSFENEYCTMCGRYEFAISFDLGKNGDAVHADGSSKSTHTETSGEYTLEIAGTSFFTGARDAKGNSCFKLGTSNNAGKFSFTVPDDIVSVIVYVAKYKTNATVVSINGTNYTIDGASDNGVYDAITIDTTTTKTVTVETTSSAKRCMINGIDLVPAPEAPAAPTEPTIVGAQVNIGADLAIKYHVYLPEGNVADYTLKITNAHGTVFMLEGELLEGNTYIFVYDGIAPQCMSDEIDAELIYDVDGDVVAIEEGYSIVKNAKNLASAKGATNELKQLLADLLAYGKAAQAYVGDDHGIESCVTADDIAAIGADPSTAAPDENINEANRDLGNPEAPEQAYISGAGVRFGNEVQIYVSIKGDNAASAKVRLGDEFYNVASVGGKYVVYLPGMSITEISEPLYIELYVDGADDPVHSITYGAYAYVYQMITKDSSTAIAKLAQALYNCAESAKSYITKA